MKRILKRYSNSTVYMAITDYIIIVGSFAVVMRLRFRPDIDIIDITAFRIIPQVLFVFLYALIVQAIVSFEGRRKRVRPLK